MLMIRLSRIGKKNKPLYRVVISEKRKDLYGDSLEILGSYNPHTKELKIDNAKTKYWLSKGAGMSQTVNNLLIEKKVIEGKKVKASKDKKGKKTALEAKPTDAKSAPAPAEATPKTAETAKTKAPTAKA